MTSDKIITKLDPTINWREQELDIDRPEKSVCIVRLGGLGDMMQTTPLLEYFKNKGYYVCLNTKDRGYELMKHNPHIDEFLLQEDGQVGTEEFGGMPFFWYTLSKKFERFVNLSGSVEEALLCTGKDQRFVWPQKARHMLMNINIYELMFAIAGIDFKEWNKDCGKFYATKREDWKAKHLVNRLKKRSENHKVILWVLSGSALHKTSPWVDATIARYMMKDKNTTFILVGDSLCQVLEHGWGDEERVVCRSGVMGIRDTMALLPHVDCVIGPETGVVQAAGSLDTKTILICSHSGPEVVSKYWKNNINLEPIDLHCYPCHILFRKQTAGCNLEPETRAAMCSYLIGPDMIEKALNKQLSRPRQPIGKKPIGKQTNKKKAASKRKKKIRRY